MTDQPCRAPAPTREAAAGARPTHRMVMSSPRKGDHHLVPIMSGKHDILDREEHEEPSRKRVRKPLDTQPSTSSGKRPAKKEREAKRATELEALNDLKSGIDFLLQSNYPTVVKGLAEEVQKLVWHLTEINDDDSKCPAKGYENSKVEGPQSQQKQADSTVNSLTDVPPPLPLDTPGATKERETQPSPYVTIPPYDSVVGIPSATSMPPLLPSITDVTLQSAPFIHSSTLPAYVRPTGTNTYEPLEFLGDAYIEIIATRIIHGCFPEHAVGQKAKLRETLVNNKTLASYARTYGFDNRVHTTQMHQTQRKGGFTKVLADCFEAYVAALILSDPATGFATAEKWLTSLWAPKIQDWVNTSGRVAIAETSNPEAKQDLEKLVVNARAARLEYLEEMPMQITKENNRQQFSMGVYLTGYGYDRQRLGSGVGRSKAVAGLEAAKDALMNNRGLVDEAHKRKLEFERLHPKPPKPPHSGQRKASHQGSGQYS